jgi:hypothetical protein
MDPIRTLYRRAWKALLARRVRGAWASFAFLCLSAGAAQAQLVFLSATLDGLQEVPPNATTGIGSGCFVLDLTAMTLDYQIEFTGLSSSETEAHIHGFAGPGATAPVLYQLPLGSPITGTIAVTSAEAQGMVNGQTYVNIHTVNNPNGEIRGQILEAPAHVRYCFGDGTGAACPCGNSGQIGGGCANSFGTGGRLAATGFASIHCDSLNLTGTMMTPQSTAVFIQGTISINPIVFGDGLRCVGGLLRRLAVTTNVSGSSHIPAAGTPSISQLGLIMMPGTYYYQTYYRDPDLTFCVLTEAYNITNAVQVTWVP